MSALSLLCLCLSLPLTHTIILNLLVLKIHRHSPFPTQTLQAARFGIQCSPERCSLVHGSQALKPSVTIGTWEGFRASRFVHWVIWLVFFLQTLTSLSPLKEDGLCGEANCQCSSMRLSVFFAIRVWWEDSFSHHFSMALGRRQSKHMESIKPPEVPHSHSDLLQFSS